MSAVGFAESTINPDNEPNRFSTSPMRTSMTERIDPRGSAHAEERVAAQPGSKFCEQRVNGC